MLNLPGMTTSPRFMKTPMKMDVVIKAGFTDSVWETGESRGARTMSADGKDLMLLCYSIEVSEKCSYLERLSLFFARELQLLF